MSLRVLVSLIVALALPALLAACGPAVPQLPANTSGAAPGHGGDAGSEVRAADGGLESRIATQPPPAMPPPAGDAGGEVGFETRDQPAPDAREAGSVPGDPVDADAGASDGTGGAPTVDGGGGGTGGDALTYDGPPPAQPRAGEVLIDELLVNPAGTDTGREWFEIVNTTALALDLRTLHVADGSKEVAVDAGVMAPGAILVLGQSIDPAKNGGAPIAVAYGNTISLNNDGDSITLCLGPCSDGLVLNSVTWGADLGAAYDGHAVMVAPDTGAFCPADRPFGTAGSFGTPGAANPPCAGPTDAGTDMGADAGAGLGGDGARG